METLIDRTIFFVMGCAFGLVLSFIVRYLREIKEELHEVDEIVKGNNPDPPRERDTRVSVKKKIPSWPNIAVALVVLLTAFAAFTSQKTSNGLEENYQADLVARCEAGVDNRNVQRDLVEAIYTLATGSLERDADQPPLTDLEVRQYNAYIDRVNSFRTESYENIKPSEQCLAYVDDDDVNPPTPPYPRFKREVTR